MDEEIKEMLEKNLALSEDNNRMIRSLRNSARLQSFFRLVYLIIFLAGIFWSYQFLKPYLDQAQTTYSAVHKYLPR